MFQLQPGKDIDSGILDIAICGHYLQEDTNKSPELEDIYRHAPSWSVPYGWIATYIMYVI